jgi:Glycosyl transferase family 2
MGLSNLPNARQVSVPPPAKPVDLPVQPGASFRYRAVSEALAIAPSVSVVIPAVNEAKNIPHVLATVPFWVDEVVLVDGRSTDGTVEVAIQICPDIKVVTQSGAGKGDALAAGFAACSKDIIVTIDGDGSTDGREILQFVGALVAGADFAKGSRFASSGRSDDITVIRRCGNRLLNMLVNRIFGTQYTDLCYGYNAFWARHVGALAVDCPGFEVETQMSIRAAKAGLLIQEIPSYERSRLYGSSNLRAIRDGWRILKLILRERLRGHWPPIPAPARTARWGSGGSSLRASGGGSGRTQASPPWASTEPVAVHWRGPAAVGAVAEADQETS